jgi:hypothetical protein
MHHLTAPNPIFPLSSDFFKSQQEIRFFPKACPEALKDRISLIIKNEY